MMIQSMHKGSSVTTVVVAGASSHGVAADFAMAAAGETPDRLMDWDTDEYERGVVTVRMYTD